MKERRHHLGNARGLVFAGLGQVGDQVVSVLWLLQTTKGHLGAWNVLLGVFKVVRHGLLGPGDTLLLVGVSVGEALGLTGLSAENTVQVRTNLVWATLLGGVALKTSGLEEVGTLLLGTLFELSWHFLNLDVEMKKKTDDGGE